MALSDWELWAAANQMIGQHGPDACKRAEDRIDELLRAGAIDGAEAWMVILTRIRTLQAKPPPPDKRH